jgi:hypothetical protein
MQDDLACTSGSNGLATTKFFKHRDGKLTVTLTACRSLISSSTLSTAF